MSKTMSSRAIAVVDDKSAKNTARSLNKLLANEYALFTKTLNYHWNISGPRFLSLHKFLEDQYKSLLTIMDDIAERIKFLDESPLSTVKELFQAKEIDEKKGDELTSNEMLHDLFTSNIKIQAFLNESVRSDDLLKDDPGTEDFLIHILQKHEMMSWKLKSHLD